MDEHVRASMISEIIKAHLEDMEAGLDSMGDILMDGFTGYRNMTDAEIDFFYQDKVINRRP